MYALRKKAAVLMLAVFTVGILGAVLHISFIDHVLLEDGRIVDVDPFTGEPDTEGESSDPLEDSCPFLSELVNANTIVSAGTLHFDSFDMVVHLSLPEIWNEVAVVEDTYMLAPSNSPPV